MSAEYKYPPRMVWADKIRELESENERLKNRLESGCFSQDEDGNIDGVPCPIWVDSSENERLRDKISILQLESCKGSSVLDDYKAENERLQKAVEEASSVICKGVQLMPLEQLNEWYGVRAWQEEYGKG